MALISGCPISRSPSTVTAPAAASDVNVKGAVYDPSLADHKDARMPSREMKSAINCLWVRVALCHPSRCMWIARPGK